MITHSLLILVLAVALVSGAATPVHATAGDSDAEFGRCGIVPIAFPPHDVVVQPDGKIIAVGYGLGRYRQDGALDRSFKGNRAIDGDVIELFSVVLQPDGKIVAAGTIRGTHGLDLALFRWLPDGAADATFGSGGMSVVAVPGTDEGPSDLVLQADGRLAVSGWSSAPGVAALLARHLPDGSPDPTFGIGGLVTITGLDPMHCGPGFLCDRPLAVQSDGKLLTVRTAVSATGNLIRIERRRTDGTPDPEFGDGGVTTSDVGFSSPIPHAVAVRPDGSIIVGGQSGEDFFLVLYRPDGIPDATFGSGAFAGVAALGSYDDDAGLFDLTLQADGKIVVVGSAAFYAVVDRFLADARPDPMFSRRPRFASIVSPNGDPTSAIAVAPAPDGKLVLAGTADGRPALMRVLGDCDEGRGCRSCARESLGHTGCALPRRSRLTLGDDGTLSWRWSGPSYLEGFGDPATTIYQLVVSGGSDLTAFATISPTARCGGTSCWRKAGGRHVYDDGVISLRLADTGKYGGAITARWRHAPLPTAVSSGGVRVGLVRLNPDRSICWSTLFDPRRTPNGTVFRPQTTR